MAQLYDWAADTQSGMQTEVARPAHQPLPVADWVDTTNSWDPTRSDARRAAQVEQHRQRQVAGVNPVNGHALDCECSRCPGWYVARARLAEQSLQPNTTGSAAPPERAPRPLQDQVIPVAILMAVFTLCSVVLLPVIVPLIALTAMSLALIVVALITVVVAMIGFMVFVMRARHEAGPAPQRGRRKTLVGQIVGRS